MPAFSSPPDPIEYRLLVWQQVRRVPPGKVSTYGTIAALVGAPPGIDPQSYKSLGPRWVGGAMAACPDDVPWQRVINAQGKISLRGGSENLQRELLEEEGVVFDDRGRVDLKRFGWNPDPSQVSQPSLFE